MVGVASQIVFCIFAAAVIGSVAGYLICHIRQNARVVEVEKLWKTKLAQRDGEIAALRGSGMNVPSSTEQFPDSKIAPETGTLSMSGDSTSVESRLSQVFSLIQKLTQSQERMESELTALRKDATVDFKLEPSTPKS